MLQQTVDPARSLVSPNDKAPIYQIEGRHPSFYPAPLQYSPRGPVYRASRSELLSRSTQDSGTQSDSYTLRLPPSRSSVTEQTVLSLSINRPFALRDDLQRTIRRLQEVADLDRDWNPYGSESPSVRATQTAWSLIVAAVLLFGERAREKALPFHIAPIADGGLHLEWQSDDAALEIFVSPSGELGYLFVDQRSSEPVYEEADYITDAKVMQLLSGLLNVPTTVRSRGDD